MTREEAIAVLSVLKSAYPNHYRNFTEKDAEDVISLYRTVFDEPLQVIIQAVTTVVCECEYPPTVAHIKQKIKVITKGDRTEKTEEEAWLEVLTALRNSNYNSQVEFDKLGRTTQRLIGSPSVLKNYAQMDSAELNTVVKSNFMRSYRNAIVERKSFENLPSSAKKLALELGGNGQLELENSKVE